MRTVLASKALLFTLLTVGCAGTRSVAVAAAPAPAESVMAPAPAHPEPTRQPSATWIGASAGSEMLLRGTTDENLGVWVDVPEAKPTLRAPMDVALVIDTSGSMQGEKIENARSAARQLIASLRAGDIVSIDTFDYAAKSLFPPTVVTEQSRSELLAAIARIQPGGSTNLFDGLSLGEAHVAQAPATHTVRRVVVISDGIANVGPSTPATLGEIAQRGLRFRAQVTSLGVGLDYDEHTLNALALRSSGRLYHLGDPGEMAQILQRELDLLASTVASEAFVELVPAAGVTLVGTEGVRSEWQGSALKIPLGALFAGQHKEALVRVRINPTDFAERMAGPSATPQAAPRALASVRLHFRDPGDGDLERVQEVVARVATTTDASEVARHANPRTQSIAAIFDAAKIEVQAAQAVNQGQFVDADKELAEAEKKLEDQARVAKDDASKKRLAAAAASVGAARQSASAVAARPKAVQRSEALKLNKQGMGEMGF
jgi:Ca-activated chloride channel family protein